MLNKVAFNTYRKKIISISGTIAIYAMIVTAILWWQHRDMLALNETLRDPNISLLDINGNPFHYSFANGEKDTLVYFFAPWCSVCHASIDNIEEVQESLPEGLNIIVIALDWSSVEEIDEFLTQHKLSMPVLLGTRKTQQNFRVSAFPSYYLVSRNGDIKARNKGYTTEFGMKLMLELKR